eukprot:gene868-9117_t
MFLSLLLNLISLGAIFGLVSLPFVVTIAVNKVKHIPGISELFPFSLLDPEKSPLHTQVGRRNFKKFGDVYRYTLGSRTYVILSNPDDFKKVLLTDYKKFGKDPGLRRATMFKSPNMFRLDPNEDWKRQRHLSSTAFSDNNLKHEFETNIDKVTNDLIKFWDTFADKDVFINASEDFGSLTLDVIGISGFGREFKTIENQDHTYAKIIHQIFYTLKYKLYLPQFLLKLPIPTFVSMRKNENNWIEYLDTIINKRRNELLEAEKSDFAFDKTDILSKMMTSPDANENPFTHDELLSNIDLFLSAGHDTTSNTLNWVFYYLALHPKYQDMICEEAKKEFGDDEVLSFDKLSKGFKVTKSVINETLRLKTPAPGVLRYSLVDYKFGDYLVPKGTHIGLSFTSCAINQEIWGKDSEEFKPERFFDLDLKDMKFGTFTPFSAGPRVCVGKRFSEMEMILILTKSMMRYKIVEGKNLNEIGEIVEATVKPSAPIQVKLSKRK